MSAAAARPMSAADRRATPNFYQQMSEPAKKMTKVRDDVDSSMECYVTVSLSTELTEIAF